MEAMAKKKGIKKGSAYLSTHPADDERIAKQNEWMDTAIQVVCTQYWLCGMRANAERKANRPHFSFLCLVAYSTKTCSLAHNSLGHDA